MPMNLLWALMLISPLASMPALPRRQSRRRALPRPTCRGGPCASDMARANEVRDAKRDLEEDLRNDDRERSPRLLMRVDGIIPVGLAQ